MPWPVSEYVRSEEAATLHAACFPRPWGAGEFARLIAQPGVFARAVIDGGRLAGFILCRSAADECEILTLAVLPACHRQGIGKALIASALEKAGLSEAKAMFLEVAAENRAAIALYRATGFAETGRRKGYYGPDGGGEFQDALVMRRDIA